MILAACGYAEAANFRYYRFSPIQVASGGTAIQISEFEFDKDGAAVAYPAGTTVVSSNPANDGGTDPGTGVKSEGAIWVIDGDTNTKWYNGGDTNGGVSSLTFDVGAGNTLDVDSYRFATANDSPERRPVSWRLEGSNDGSAWTTLDLKGDYPTSTNAFTYTDLISIPAAPSAIFTSFAYSPAIVQNGSQFSFTYSTENASSVTIAPGSLTLDPAQDSQSATPPATAETVFTLTAASATGGDQALKSFVVRSVENATQTYRYVRFTPLASGNNQVDIADLQFTFYDTNGNLDHYVDPVQITYDGETTVDTNDTYRPDNLRDANSATEWYSGTFRPIVFDFGSPQAFNHYAFTLTGALPDYTPTRWRMEGSNDSTSWKPIENVSSFDYPMPKVANAFVGDLPLPTNASVPLELSDFYATHDTTTGDTTLHWYAIGASSVTIAAGAGAPVDVSNVSSLVVHPPAADTLYTISATSAQDPSAAPVVYMLSLSPSETTVPALPNYPDLATVGTSIQTNGKASFINNYADASNALNAAGDRMRLNILPDETASSGSAFFKTPVTVTGGFDTTFDLYISTKDRGYGADGVSFVIQNTAEGASHLPAASGQFGPDNNAVAIEFSTWNNNPVGTETYNEGKIRLYKNQVPLDGGIFGVENTAVHLHSDDFPVYYGPSFVGTYNSAPYKVHITYSADKKLNMTIDDVSIISDYTLDLSGATDSSGKAYVGFTAANGGWSEDDSLTSWVFSTGSVTPASDLKITSSSFDFTANTLTLNWNSVTGTTYRVTRSATLNGSDWVAIGSTATATGASTSLTVPFTKGTKDFFRVEVAP